MEIFGEALGNQPTGNCAVLALYPFPGTWYCLQWCFLDMFVVTMTDLALILAPASETEFLMLVSQGNNFKLSFYEWQGKAVSRQSTYQRQGVGSAVLAFWKTQHPRLILFVHTVGFFPTRGTCILLVPRTRKTFSRHVIPNIYMSGKSSLTCRFLNRRGVCRRFVVMLTWNMISFTSTWILSV